MAELSVDGDELVVHLNALEKAEAVHGDVRVPLSSVRRVEVLDDAVAAVHGFRVGTGVPGWVAIGTFTSRNAHIFAVVHHNTPRGVHVDLDGAQFDELIIGCDNPELEASKIPAL